MTYSESSDRDSDCDDKYRFTHQDVSCRFIFKIKPYKMLCEFPVLAFYLKSNVKLGLEAMFLVIGRLGHCNTRAPPRKSDE